MKYACPLRECMATHAHNITTVKVRWLADGKRSRRIEGFHMFRVRDPKIWLGNTKIAEAFVYQLCCGYRTVKSRRQPVKITTNCPASRALLFFLLFTSAWLRAFVDASWDFSGESGNNRLCSSIPYHFSIVKT